MRKNITIVLIVALAASIGLAAMPAFPAIESGEVSIFKGSTINLVSRESSFPVAVTNSFAGEIQVLVKLRSNSAKVIVEDSSVQLSIPAGTTVNAQFPIRAIGSGEVVMVAWLTSLSGIELGSQVPIRLIVNPDIETAAIVLFLVFVAGLLTFGVIRTMRRRRTT